MLADDFEPPLIILSVFAIFFEADDKLELQQISLRYAGVKV
jgi:hypothetical protein